MKYKEFIENNNRRNSKRVNFNKVTINRRMNSNDKFEKTVEVSNGKEAGKAIYDHIKVLEKGGSSVVKIFFNIFSGVIKIGFKIVGDGVNFIGGNLRIYYHSLNPKKQKTFVNSLVVGAMAFLVGFGFTIKHINPGNKALASQAEVQETLVVNDKEKSLEIEINDNTNESLTKTKTENEDSLDINEDKSSLNKESNIELTTARAIVSTKTINESFKDIEFKKMDGDKTTNVIDVRYKDKDTKEVVKITSKAYGLAGFSTIENKKCVSDFIKYIKEVDLDFYNEYFDGVDAPGTITFDTGWYSANKTEKEKFNLMQINYVYDKYVHPTVKSIKNNYGIDLMSSKALKEFAFSTGYDYGREGTLMLFEKANINSNMGEKEIIEKVQAEKINSLGDYTYTNEWKYTDSDRELAKSNISKELERLLKLI